MLTKTKIIPLLIVIVIIFSLFYLFKGQLIVATVNGQPITRLTLISELEKQSGKKALDYLITRTLILQEAQKQKVTVSDKEVNDQLKQLQDNIAKSGQDYSQLLKTQGITEKDLKEQIRIQKIIDKIVGKDISVSDAEVNDYLEKNKEMLPKDTKPEEIKPEIQNQLLQQKLNDKTQTWLKSLRDKAKITTSY